MISQVQSIFTAANSIWKPGVCTPCLELIHSPAHSFILGSELGPKSLLMTGSCQ